MNTNIYNTQNRKNGMRLLIGILLVLTILPLTSALAEYNQFKLFINNETSISHEYVRNHISFFYTKQDNALIVAQNPTPPFNWWTILFPTGNIPIVLNPLTNAQWDFVTAGKQYEVYIQYTIYPNAWNSLNPNQTVDFCNMTIKQFPSHSNTAQTIFNKYVNASDMNIYGAKFFSRMSDGDFISANLDCKFTDATSIVDIPADFSLVTPTWECKACQFHKWLVQEQNIRESEVLSNGMVTVFSYIKSLFVVNFEIIIFLFWIGLILSIFLALGLLIYGLYHIYKWITNMASK